MDIYTKRFDELSTAELYEILRLRAEIFVVEQDCVYQDLDGIDYESLHIYIRSGGRIPAYARVYRSKDEPDAAYIGRVVTAEHRRGYGGIVLAESIKAAWTLDGITKIYVKAQCYAEGFYKKYGFRTISGEFMLDGIPHIKMEINRRDEPCPI